MTEQSTFAELNLAPEILQAVNTIGYETPSPIQAASIPFLLAGRDLLGVAQTGTGKTAAFALPLLSRLNPNLQAPQLLVLVPTRELAIQVAEACQTYASKMKNFRVLPVYGGSNISTQLRQLRQGAQVIVGTPGRIMDHLRRQTLHLKDLQAVVLDEADEMLRMGFIDDVTWILDQTPDKVQVALFSATMPRAIRNVADRYLDKPEEVRIKPKENTRIAISQSYWMVNNLHKLDALSRVLETEEFDGVIVFVRTKNQTLELADKLTARGYNAAAINGDMVQKTREHTIDQLKKSKIDILVATDVAARGIDVDRISHVMNYDIPYDGETYVHRIGRTGRAGRSGKAILFIAPRERHLLRSIERTTQQPLLPLEMPTRADVNSKRQQEFKTAITGAMESIDLKPFESLVQEILASHDTDPSQLAAALAYLAQQDKPIFLDTSHDPLHNSARQQFRDSRDNSGPSGRPPRQQRSRDSNDQQSRPARRTSRASSSPMDNYRIAMGRNQNVRPADIVGAIANEANINSRDIGRIQLHDDYSTVELPQDLPSQVFKALQKVHVRNKPMSLERVTQRA